MQPACSSFPLRRQRSFFEAIAHPAGDAKALFAVALTCLVAIGCGRPTIADVRLEVDAEGEVHALYQRAKGNDARDWHLVYARRDGGSWSEETVYTVPQDEIARPQGILEMFTAFALDPGGHPHAAFFERRNDGAGSLRYAHRSDGAWRVETVEVIEGEALVFSLAADAEGRAHLAVGRAQGDLQYIRRDGDSSWHVESLPAYAGPRIPGGNVTAGLTPEGHPHVTYQGDEGIVHAQWTGSGLESETIFTDDDPVRHLLYGARAMVVDGAGRPHIVYEQVLSSSASELRHAHWDGEAWVTETIDSFSGDLFEVDTDPYVSMSTSPELGLAIAMDTSGGAHVLYPTITWGPNDSAEGMRPLESKALRYARRGDTGWTTRIVASTEDGDLEFDADLAVHAPDEVHIAYYQWFSGQKNVQLVLAEEE